MTPFIWDNPDKFLIGNYKNKKGNFHNHYRFTLDFIEDYYLIFFIFNYLYPKNKSFKLEDIINFFKKNKKMMQINRKFIKVNWYSKYLKDLKTISKKDTKL